MKPKFQFFVLTISLLLGFSLTDKAQTEYPAWTYSMKIRPFDILYPFDTEFSKLMEGEKTSDAQIISKLNSAKNDGANVVIFYIDDEQSYETFVDSSGFNKTVNRIKILVNEAHKLNLKVVCYLNGLEAITVGASVNSSMPSLARNYPEWLQKDITGKTMVWNVTSETEWIPENSEDAWASPLSPWKDLFKERLKALGKTGLDGVYIDATFLPGIDHFGIKWASTDIYFKTEFQNKYGLSIPAQIDWQSERWRKFIYFRHEVIRNYLGELADYARQYGMVPFFESSACDFTSGTYLANDVPFTISGGIACSPEIEPEGDFAAAFRMIKSTKDANQNFPVWFLGWPENAENSRKEFAVTLCCSGNYYPTVDAEYPANAFAFMDGIRDSILNRRIPVQNTALIYSMRDKDYTFETEAAFNLYNNAFQTLEEKHIPFRILPLAGITSKNLQNINNVVLAGVESISDAEYNLLKGKTVALIGKNGTKDEWGSMRGTVLTFVNQINITDIKPNLPFSISAPSSSFIEYYIDKTDKSKYFIFIYSDKIKGKIYLAASKSMSARIYTLDNNYLKITGNEISIPLKDYLEVIELKITGTTDVRADENKNYKFNIINYPNPFNPTTTIEYSIPPTGANTSMITLKIYDTLGNKIATLVNRKQLSGNYKVAFNGKELNSGIYFYRITIGKLSMTKKMCLIK